MTPEQQRELYLMLRDDDLGGNRGREFYDGRCQSCDCDVYECHDDGCHMVAMLELLGGDEERERQRIRREARDAERAERKAVLARHKRGVTTSSLDAMNLAFKEIYGGFKVERDE